MCIGDIGLFVQRPVSQVRAGENRFFPRRDDDDVGSMSLSRGPLRMHGSGRLSRPPL